MRFTVFTQNSPDADPLPNFRAVKWTRTLTSFAVQSLKWYLIVLLAQTLVSWGRYTRFGLGLVGGVFPVLVVEALAAKRCNWRVRLLNSVGLFIPVCTLLVFVVATPGLCCFCDQSPWGVTLRGVEFVGDFLYYNAIAILPAFLLLTLLGLQPMTIAERHAYTRTTFQAFLATLCVTVTFVGALFAVRSQFAFLP